MDGIEKVMIEYDHMVEKINSLTEQNKVLMEAVEAVFLCENHLPNCHASKYLVEDSFECKCYDHDCYSFENMIELSREAKRKIEAMKEGE